MRFGVDADEVAAVVPVEVCSSDGVADVAADPSGEESGSI
jgi:hypothetical protein